MAWQYAPRLALIAVVTVLGRGLLCGGEFGGTVKAAALAAAAFFGLGLLVGEIARRLVEEQLAREAGDPRPGDTAGGGLKSPAA